MWPQKSIGPRSGRKLIKLESSNRLDHLFTEKKQIPMEALQTLWDLVVDWRLDFQMCFDHLRSKIL